MKYLILISLFFLTLSESFQLNSSHSFTEVQNIFHNHSENQDQSHHHSKNDHCAPTHQCHFGHCPVLISNFFNMTNSSLIYINKTDYPIFNFYQSQYPQIDSPPPKAV
jgi:hypothetical protein